MLLRQTRSLSSLMLALCLATTAQVAGNISFSGAAAVQDINLLAAKAVAKQGAAQAEPQLGINRAIMSPVTPAQSEQAIRSRVLPADLNKGVSAKTTTTVAKNRMAPQLSATRISGDTAATGPGSIPELARALKNDPDLIYEYVRSCGCP